MERGGEGGAEGGGGGSSSLRTHACAPAGEASAAGERRRAFFARSACIGSPPCSCGGVVGDRASTAAGGGCECTRGGMSWWCASSEHVPASDGASEGGGRLDRVGIGGGHVSEAAACGIAPQGGCCSELLATASCDGMQRQCCCHLPNSWRRRSASAFAHRARCSAARALLRCCLPVGRNDACCGPGMVRAGWSL